MNESYELLWASKLYGQPVTPEEYHKMVAWYIDTYVEDRKDAQ